MVSDPVLFFKVLALPPVCVANAFYYVLRDDGTFDQYLTDATGQPVPSKSGDQGVEPYRHVQAVPSAVWIVNHNLGRYVAAVTVLTVGGVEMLADVVRVSVNQLRVQLAAPMVGSVLVF